MTTRKNELLKKAYDTLQQLVWYNYPLDQAREIAVEDVMGYGTNIDEKILDFTGFLKLVRDQREQSVGMEVSLETTPVLRRVTSDENVAVFVDEIKVTMIIGGDKNEAPLRVSWIFEFRKDRWFLIHWHGSSPIHIEGDSWQKDIWKKKNEELQRMVDEKTVELKKSIEELKSTQAQLIQSEKMASLGELTAGIAHEIQNPLNFVNNFSEVSNELISEMVDEVDKGNTDEVKIIAKDIQQNLEKILHHGKRADAIVKGMLQHSGNGGGKKEPTNINALTDEYLRLAYHGLRGKDNSFNVTMKTAFDENIGKINVIPQDIGRVLLNLYNNAFYAASLPSKGGFSDPDKSYNPTIWVNTKKMDDKVLISVRDNGPGIPQKIVDKIFQPFFTTKPTGQGTGLGLSLSYDIVKAHGGEIKVNTMEGEGSEFVIQLPIK